MLSPTQRLDLASDVDTSTFLKLISNDGEVFVVDKKCAFVSKRIETLLTKGTTDKKLLIETVEDDIIPLTLRLDTSAKHLEKMIQYWYFKNRYEHDPSNRPTFEVPPEMALELIQVAQNYKC